MCWGPWGYKESDTTQQMNNWKSKAQVDFLFVLP